MTGERQGDLQHGLGFQLGSSLKSLKLFFDFFVYDSLILICHLLSDSKYILSNVSFIDMFNMQQKDAVNMTSKGFNDTEL